MGELEANDRLELCGSHDVELLSSGEAEFDVLSRELGPHREIQGDDHVPSFQVDVGGVDGADLVIRPGEVDLHSGIDVDLHPEILEHLLEGGATFGHSLIHRWRSEASNPQIHAVCAEGRRVDAHPLELASKNDIIPRSMDASTFAPIVRNISSSFWMKTSSQSSDMLAPYYSTTGYLVVGCGVFEPFTTVHRARKISTSARCAHMVEAPVLEDTDRTSGRDALRRNILSAMAVAGAVRSTLGPFGLDKLLVDQEGHSTVTNDGMTVLDEARIEHPTALRLVEASRTVGRSVADGTTSTVLLSAEMLANAWNLIGRGFTQRRSFRGSPRRWGSRSANWTR